MSGLLLIILGIGSLALYFSLKIFSNKCNPNYPIEIQNHIQNLQDNDNDNDNEIPPRYEDIVNSN